MPSIPKWYELKLLIRRFTREPKDEGQRSKEVYEQDDVSAPPDRLLVLPREEEQGDHPY
jgi:hypothetical protein